MEKKEEIAKVSMFALKLGSVEDFSGAVILSGRDLEAAVAAAHWILKQLLNKSKAGKANKGVKKTFKPRKKFKDLSPSGKYKRLKRKNSQ